MSIQLLIGFYVRLKTRDKSHESYSNVCIDHDVLQSEECVITVTLTWLSDTCLQCHIDLRSVHGKH